MAAISESIVREYFELQGFLVRQQRKYIAPTKREDEEIDFYVFNPQPKTTPDPMPFILGNTDVLRLNRAIVVVKGWHTETFSQSFLSHAPEIFRFLEPTVFHQAERELGGPATKILVVPALPTGAEARTQSIELLKTKGVDAIIPFRTMLSGLIDATETNRNYQRSDILQMIRILKNYEFFKEPQLELFKSKRRAAPRKKSQSAAE